MSKLPTTLRLDRLLANLGYGSRREVQNMVRSGRVTLEGEPLDDPDQRLAIKPELSERMRIDGKPLDPPPGLTLMLHKPLGVTCSHKEDGTAGLRSAARALAPPRPGALDDRTSRQGNVGPPPAHR